MSELATKSAPYANLMKNDDGERVLTWDQVSAMTAKQGGTGLRPTLPDEMDADVVDLIRSSWDEDPGLRPSFAVILLRLDAISRKQTRQSSKHLLEQEMDDALHLCRRLHRVLWQSASDSWWNAKKARLLLDDTFEAKAKDPTLAKILSSDKGPFALKSLAVIMVNFERSKRA